MRHLSRVIRLLFFALGFYVGAGVLARVLRRLLPFPVPPAMDRLLNPPLRDLAQAPKATLERIGLAPGMRVLEVGVGPGSLTVEAARLVGPEGKLYVIDCQPEMVALAAGKVHEAGLENVEVHLADPKSLPFPDGAFDMAFLVTSLSEIPNRGRAFRELRRVLKPNGRLSVTEAITDPGYSLMAEVVGWAQMVGFELVEQHGTALLYTLNFRSLLGP